MHFLQFDFTGFLSNITISFSRFFVFCVFFMKISKGLRKVIITSLSKFPANLPTFKIFIKLFKTKPDFSQISSLGDISSRPSLHEAVLHKCHHFTCYCEQIVVGKVPVNTTCIHMAAHEIAPATNAYDLLQNEFPFVGKRFWACAFYLVFRWLSARRFSRYQVLGRLVSVSKPLPRK